MGYFCTFPFNFILPMSLKIPVGPLYLSVQMSGKMKLSGKVTRNNVPVLQAKNPVGLKKTQNFNLNNNQLFLLSLFCAYPYIHSVSIIT